MLESQAAFILLLGLDALFIGVLRLSIVLNVELVFEEFFVILF